LKTRRGEEVGIKWFNPGERKINRVRREGKYGRGSKRRGEKQLDRGKESVWEARERSDKWEWRGGKEIKRGGEGE
jgi:hypothetical protein